MTMCDSLPSPALGLRTDSAVSITRVELALNLKHESAVHASMTTSVQGAGTCKEGKEAALKRTSACIQIPSTHRKNQV